MENQPERKTNVSMTGIKHYTGHTPENLHHTLAPK